MEILSKKEKMQIWVKILLKNVFENTKTNTFNLYEIFNWLHSDLVFLCVLCLILRYVFLNVILKLPLKKSIINLYSLFIMIISLYYLFENVWEMILCNCLYCDNCQNHV